MSVIFLQVGFVFPYEGMFEVAQYIAEALPATHFVRLICGMVLRDVEIIDMTLDVSWLALFIIAGLAVASLRFKQYLIKIFERFINL